MDVGRVERVFRRVVWIRTYDGESVFARHVGQLRSGDPVVFEARDGGAGAMRVVRCVVRVRTLIRCTLCSVALLAFVSAALVRSSLSTRVQGGQ